MRQLIPAHVIAPVSEVVADAETHATRDRLFMYGGAPGDPPLGSKPAKTQEWLRRVNKDESVQPLDVLGRIIEGYMEADLEHPSFGEYHKKRKDLIERALARAELTYVRGGRVTGVLATPSRTLEDLIRGGDLVALDEEFGRALRNVESNPREAVSAACNILESVCKTYIQDEGLEMPAKQDLRSVWDVVRRKLGFDPSLIEDKDLKEILSGLFAIVGGIASLRTHASSAHGVAPKGYRLEPRHARLAAHAAHTLVVFILECWDKKRAV